MNFSSGKKIRISKPLIVLLHVLVWLAMIGIPLYFLLREPFGMPPAMPRHPGPHENMPVLGERKLFSFIKSNILLILLFYFNEYVLVPGQLKKKGLGWYVLFALATVILFTLADNVLAALIMHRNEFVDLHFFLSHLIPMVVILAISSTFWLVSDQHREQEKQKEMETERLSSELSFLRSQVSPHFMFNVLNSVIALARKKSDLLEPVVIKLSNLLRYMLYESDVQRISLASELEYLGNYIDLQRMRFGEDVNILFSEDEAAGVKSPGKLLIEPMLLIPFVENAFKHGVGMIINPSIEVKLHIEKNVLHFHVFNKHNPNSRELKDKNSGIGLYNVKRRLNLLYPEKHQLEIEELNGWYRVYLSLTLN